MRATATCGATSRLRTERGQLAHAGDTAREHHLDGILNQRRLERHHLGDEIAIALEVRPAVRVADVQPLVHDLAGAGAVEDQRRRVAEVAGGIHNGPGNPGRQQVADQRLAVAPLDQRSAAHDERERPVNLLDDRPGEIEAPPRHERNLDAGIRGLPDRFAIRRRHLPAAVEKRAVDVQGDQADHRDLTMSVGTDDVGRN